MRFHNILRKTKDSEGGKLSVGFPTFARMECDKKNMRDRDRWCSGRWSLNACGYTITCANPVNGGASRNRVNEQPRPSNWSGTYRYYDGPPDDLQRVARREFNRAGSNCAPSGIYVARSRRSVSEITYRDRVSWICYAIDAYARTPAMNMHGSITFNHVLEKLRKKKKRSKSSPQSRSMTIVEIRAIITIWNNSFNIRASGYKIISACTLGSCYAYFERWVTDCVCVACINFLRCIIITVVAAYCAASVHRVCRVTIVQPR